MKILAAVVAMVALAGAAPAEASFQPQNLHVIGGEETWHADRSFELRWSNPAGVTAVHYRVMGESRGPAPAETTLDWPATAIEHLNVPPAAGVYTAEVWLEDAAGQLGPPASAKLRFDDVPPGPAKPAPPSAWIDRNAFPLSIGLGRPPAPEPLSGIRGYAFSIDRDPEGEPCAGARLCDETETDLNGGGDDNVALLPGLPEGTSYLHAAAVSGSGVRSSTETVALHVDAADPATSLSGGDGGWSRQPVALLARASDSASGMEPSGTGAPFTAIRIDDGVPITAAGASVTATVIASGVHTVAYYARDAAGNVPDGAVVNGRRNAEPATAVVRIDRESPSLAFAVAQDPSDPERIEAVVRDSLSGFNRSRGEIGVRPAGSRQRFRPLSTRATSSGLEARWDSSSYPPGSYEFRVTAYDAAGNAASSLLRANGSRMVLCAPLKTATTLLAGFGERASRSVPFGQSVSFSGRLIAGRHTPLVGRTVRVVERFAPGSRPGERISTVRTGRDGRFSVRLEPGPSREVVATVAPTATLAGASSGPAELQVRGRIGMRASSATATVGGRPVVFSGRVAATPLPPGGKEVELQFRLPGLPWSQFRTVTTDARGRFRYAYRFVDDDSRGARFQFRAFSPRQSGWPYEPAASKSVSVLGR